MTTPNGKKRYGYNIHVTFTQTPNVNEDVIRQSIEAVINAYMEDIDDIIEGNGVEDVKHSLSHRLHLYNIEIT